MNLSQSWPYFMVRVYSPVHISNTSPTPWDREIGSMVSCDFPFDWNSIKPLVHLLVPMLIEARKRYRGNWKVLNELTSIMYQRQLASIFSHTHSLCIRTTLRCEPFFNSWQWQMFLHIDLDMWLLTHTLKISMLPKFMELFPIEPTSQTHGYW